MPMKGTEPPPLEAIDSEPKIPVGLRKLLTVALFLLLSGVQAAAADYPGSEVGAVFSATHFPGGGEAGLGARFLHNYTPEVGFEFQGAFYPVSDAVNFYQLSLHLKGTYRIEERRKVNVFGLLGPALIVTDPERGGMSTRFGLNAGGGVEFVPRPQWAIRADLTDFVFFSDDRSFNNFDFKLGLMYRW